MKRVPLTLGVGGEQIGWAEVHENGEALLTLFEGYEETEASRKARQIMMEGLTDGFSIGRKADNPSS